MKHIHVGHRVAAPALRLQAPHEEPVTHDGCVGEAAARGQEVAPDQRVAAREEANGDLVAQILGSRQPSPRHGVSARRVQRYLRGRHS